MALDKTPVVRVVDTTRSYRQAITFQYTNVSLREAASHVIIPDTYEHMGSNRFKVDMPRYVEFYKQGRLLLDEMVTRRLELSDINEAFRAMKAGEVARSVIMF